MKATMTPQPQHYQSTTYLSVAPPPPCYNLQQLLNDIRKMCHSFVPPAAPHPTHSNDDTITMPTTTTTTTTTADSCQALVPLSCSDSPACCMMTTDATTPSPDAEPTSPTTTMLKPLMPINNDDAMMTLLLPTSNPMMTSNSDNDTMATPTNIMMLSCTLRFPVRFTPDRKFRRKSEFSSEFSGIPIFGNSGPPLGAQETEQ